MSNYRDIDMLRTTELYVARKGWFKPVYTLTDGQFDYGRISCAGAFTRTKNIETADAKFMVKPKGFFGKTVEIINQNNGEVIGSYKKNGWETRVALEMNNGLTTLLKKGKGFFSRKMFWTDDQNGDYIEINNCGRLHKPFKIKFDPNAVKTKLPLALLTLIGVNFILIKQAQAASAGI
ncbi:hypothetical protein [Mucilaginibacter sp. dw_454]|uniref:hypothetical protein n=1 Tax=Mucilaginibacter sp. dw_454 TaxID=2720079 RepID=UPI001BD621B5|nr:hypothetical protein [Mucilaginibacter sp. dw_454]